MDSGRSESPRFSSYYLILLIGSNPLVPLGAILVLIWARLSRTPRIWMLMLAHAAFDLTALAMIYFDLETNVAHLVFK